MGVDLVLIVVGGLTRWLVVLLLVVVPATAPVVVIVVGVAVVILLVVSLVPRLLRWWLRVTVIVIVDLSSRSLPLLRLVFRLFIAIEMATSTTISPTIMGLRWLVASARWKLVVLVIATTTTTVVTSPGLVPPIPLRFVIIGVVLHRSSRSSRGLLILLLLMSLALPGGWLVIIRL